MATDTPGKKDISYYSGDSLSRSYTINDSDSVPVSLTGKDLILTIKKRKTGDIVSTLTTPTEIVISGTSTNLVTLNFNVDLEERDYYYDLYNSTDDYTIMYGRLKVTKEVHE